jgi:hypothetical protein
MKRVSTNLAIAVVAALPGSTLRADEVCGPLFGNPEFATGANPQSVAVGDLDGDGDKDVATACEGIDGVSIHLRNGDGSYAAPVQYGAGSDP